LERFNIIDNTECECRGGPESVRHYLLECQVWEEERDALRRRVGHSNMRLETLLGDPRCIKETIEFIESTDRLQY